MRPLLIVLGIAMFVFAVPVIQASPLQTMQEETAEPKGEPEPDTFETPHRINTAEEHFEAAKTAEEEMEKARIEAEQKEEESHWKSLGYCRITEYCPSCNDPRGSYQSSSGAHLEEGMVACSWLDNYTRIRIGDSEYIVTDYCGTDAIDIFCDTDSCMCDANYWTEVYVYE